MMKRRFAVTLDGEDHAIAEVLEHDCTRFKKPSAIGEQLFCDGCKTYYFFVTAGDR